MRPIVIENGSAYSKNGFAGEDHPRSIWPTLIGYTKYRNTEEGRIRNYYVGEELLDLRGVLKLIYPIEHGIITDWGAMEKIWHYTFHKDLRVNPAEHPVLFTEPPLNPTRNREKMEEILFETFNVPALYISNQSVLTLYASGRTTGVVVDIGAEVTTIVPIYEGFQIRHAIDRIDLGGREVTKYLGRLLRQRGYALTHSDKREILRKIKEKYCYIAIDPERELNAAKQAPIMKKPYTLPSGENVIIGYEKFLAPEALLNPVVLGRDQQSLSEAIYESIQNTGIDIRRELYRNIVLSGGSTMFPGMKERLQKKLIEMVPENIEIRIVAPPLRQYSVWIGGSILSSLKTFQKLWITRKDYHDVDRSQLYYQQIQLHQINDLSCPFCGGSKVLRQGGQENQTDKKRICVSCKNSF